MAKKKTCNDVGELMAFLAKLDPKMPLTRWGGGGMFERGVEVEVRKLRKLKQHPSSAVLNGDKVFTNKQLDEPFLAAIF